MARSLNKVQLIGNLTRDPELRYTPQGAAVCDLGIATNRSWKNKDSDEWQEETEFHSVVVWRLAERCAEQLSKGKKVYVEGRLHTRSWETQEGDKRYKTEIVADEVIFLDAKGREEGSSSDENSAPSRGQSASAKAESQSANQDVNPDEIPF